MKNYMIKRFLIAALGVLALVSCEDLQEPDHHASTDPEIFYKSEKLFFSTYPQSGESVNFVISPLASDQLLKKIILLSKESDTLATGQLSPVQFNRFLGQINFDFKSGEVYQLLIEEQVNKDSLNIYQLPDYKHVFEAKINRSLLTKFERLYDFDLSPDRDFLFLQDFAMNIRSNYRLQLSTGQLLKLGDDIGGKIRAVGRDKLLHINSGIYESEILIYDVEKKTSVPFGLTSGNQGSITRVKDDHIVFTNPITNDERTLTVVNLTNNERRVVPAFAFGYSIREYVIGQKIFGNSLFDIESGTLSEELSPFQGTALLQYNQEEDIVFYMQGLGPEASEEGYSSKFIAAKRGGQPVFDSGLEKNVSYHLPSETRILDNKFLVYVSYGLHQDEHRISGFYKVDLLTGKMELIQSVSLINTSPSALVQLEDNLWMTLFSGEISLIKID